MSAFISPDHQELLRHIASPFGSHTEIGSGPLPNAIRQAIDEAGGHQENVEFSDDEIGRIIYQQEIIAGIQVKNGTENSKSITFHAASAQLASGRYLTKSLVLKRIENVSVLYWMISLQDTRECLTFYHAEGAREAWDIITMAGGGVVGDITHHLVVAPTYEVIAELERNG